MNKKIYYLIIILMLTVALFMLCGCREVTWTQYDIKKEADNFERCRRIVVLNARTDKVEFELIGTFSLQNNNSKEIEIICKTGEDEYKTHYIYLNDYTLYFVEDLTGIFEDEYYYEANYLPETVISYGSGGTR